MDQSLDIGNKAIYCLAGASISSLFIYLIEKKNGGVVLCRADIIDRIITSEDWFATLEEAKSQAAAESGQATFNWKSIPGNIVDPVAYIFEHEPRLTVKLNLNVAERKKIPLVIYLVWADFALASLISLVQSKLDNTQIPAGLDKALPIEMISSGSANLLFITLNFLFTLTLSFQLVAGKRWARTMFLISCAVTLFPIVFQPGKAFGESGLVGVMSLLEAGAEIYALWLLYSGDNAKRFSRK